MPDKTSRRATVKKPSKTIKQKRAAKRLKVEQANRRDIVAAVIATDELTRTRRRPQKVGTESLGRPRVAGGTHLLAAEWPYLNQPGRDHGTAPG
jgi:hypothetical protein